MRVSGAEEYDPMEKSRQLKSPKVKKCLVVGDEKDLQVSDAITYGFQSLLRMVQA